MANWNINYATRFFSKSTVTRQSHVKYLWQLHSLAVIVNE